MPIPFYVNEGDIPEAIAERINRSPNVDGWFLVPSLNKDRTGLWKPSEKERLDLMLEVLKAQQAKRNE